MINAIKIDKDNILIQVSKEELGVLSNALNEVCNGIEVWEFDTRMGTKIEDAKAILDSLISIYQQAGKLC